MAQPKTAVVGGAQAGIDTIERGLWLLLLLLAVGATYVTTNQKMRQQEEQRPVQHVPQAECPTLPPRNCAADAAAGIIGLRAAPEGGANSFMPPTSAEGILLMKWQVRR